jgi:hypothetical protein
MLGVCLGLASGLCGQTASTGAIVGETYDLIPRVPSFLGFWFDFRLNMRTRAKLLCPAKSGLSDSHRCLPAFTNLKPVKRVFDL